MVPQNYVKLENEDDIKNMEKLIDLLEDNDDVQNVWHNWIRSNFRHSKRRSGFVQTSCLFITLPRKIRPAI